MNTPMFISLTEMKEIQKVERALWDLKSVRTNSADINLIVYRKSDGLELGRFGWSETNEWPIFLWADEQHIRDRQAGETEA